MTVKTETRLIPSLLSHRHYSGMGATLLYNWPIFVGGVLFSVVILLLSGVVPSPWHWLFMVSGIAMMSLLITILGASYWVYDWGQSRDYDRLAELGNLQEAKVVVDITCGKLRGTRGFLPHFIGGHYFLVDIYDETTMTDQALKRARVMEPPLNSQRKIFQRTAQANRIPIPPNWVDIIYCSYSLHELQNEADREIIFKQFTRMLKPGGHLLIAEHDRDWRNFLAFGPGAYTFFATSTWENHFATANLHIKHHERWRGLVNLWVLTRK